MITCLAKFWIRESDSEEKKRRVYGTLGAVVGIFLNRNTIEAPIKVTL